MRYFLIVTLLLQSSISYSQDYLLQAMYSSWVNTPVREKEEPDDQYESSGGGGEEPEHYSWDNLYRDPYEETVIIFESGCDSY